MQYLLIGFSFGMLIGYILSTAIVYAAERKRQEARHKRSAAAKKGHLRKAETIAKVDPSLYGRKINGSGMADSHE